jgi:hypothetical protein
MLGISIPFVSDRVGVLSLNQSIYSSALAIDSQSYSRLGSVCAAPNYYYEAIQLNVVEDGIYSLWSSSTMDTYGYLYNNTFNPFNPSTNLLTMDDDSNGGGQFRLTTDLQANTTYLLLVTTYSRNVVGPFSIFVSGPNNVNLNRSREYMY